MFKGFNNRQQHGFPNINFGGNYGQAYNFSRCLLWLDAAYGTSTVVNGANVSSWQDKINGVIYSQGTAANQPTYVASDSSFNNFPTINFGTTQSRALSGSTQFGLGSNTLVTIVRNNVVSGNAFNLIIGSGTNIGFFGGGANANVTGFGYGSNTGTPSFFTRSNIEDTLMHIVISNRNFIIVDGINATSVINSNFGFNFSAIGAVDVSTLLLPQFTIAEVLLYDYLMSETDAIQLSANINAKYLKY